MIMPSIKLKLDAISTLWLVIASFVNVGMASKWVNDLGKGDFGS